MLNKINKMLRQEQGFTLMELMIVVVIIGILAAIAVPTYNGVQEKARLGVGKANAEMLNRAKEQMIYLDQMIDKDAWVGGKAWTGSADDITKLLEFVDLTSVQYVKVDDDGQFEADGSIDAVIP